MNESCLRLQVNALCYDKTPLSAVGTVGSRPQLDSKQTEEEEEFMQRDGEAPRMRFHNQQSEICTQAIAAKFVFLLKNSTPPSTFTRASKICLGVQEHFPVFKSGDLWNSCLSNDWKTLCKLTAVMGGGVMHSKAAQRIQTLL